MNKKFISIAMSLVLACSALAATASAAEVEEETAGAEVTVETSGEGNTIKFDPGDWNSSKIQFYIWDETAQPTQYATSSGWTDENPWGSKKKLGGTKLDDGTFESYELDLPDGHDIFVIFYDPDTGAQTFNCVLNSSAYGDTARRTGEILENPVDSEKTAEAVLFDNSGLGAQLCITSSGKIQGTTITPNTDCPLKVAEFVYTYLGQTEKLSGELIVTEATVAGAIAAFGTTADDVWAKFQGFKGQEGKEDYDAKEAEAKKLIKPTEAAATDSEKEEEDDNNNNNSSKTSTTTTTTTTTSKTTTTTTSKATTSGTATTADAAATGDATGTVAFAVVLLAAAATIVVTRKKVQD